MLKRGMKIQYERLNELDDFEIVTGEIINIKFKKGRLQNGVTGKLPCARVVWTNPKSKVIKDAWHTIRNLEKFIDEQCIVLADKIIVRKPTVKREGVN